jgi:putative membrane protein
MTHFGRRLVMLLTKLAINALALVVVDAMFQGIWLDSTRATIAAAVVLALVNTYLRPLLLILTLPLTVLTLGLFTIVINAGLLLLVSWLIPQFHVATFWTAVGAALVISVISFLLNWFLQPNGVQIRTRRSRR